MRIGVIMGGISSEREVSLSTGNEMIQHLDKNKYEVFPIVINSKEDIIEKAKNIDVALLALHGKFGEDGAIQSILEALNIPYTGCGILSSAICMDKDTTKRLLRDSNIKVADWIIVKNIEELNFEKIKSMGYPVVVKPNSGGSSVGTTIVKDEEAVINAVQEALKYDKEVMIEEFITGEEITCPLLNGEVLPTLSIKPASVFYDYTAKYTDGGADMQVVKLEEALQKEINNIALTCYKVLKCSVYSRVDLILHDGIPYVLEMNTLPGMTSHSLLPKSAKSIGISYSQLLDLIIQYSLVEKR